MVWEPFALAVVMGLLVSAAIYFIVMWPQVEPPDPDDALADSGPEPAAEPDRPGDGTSSALSSDA